LAKSFRVDILAEPEAIPEPSVTLRPKHGLRGRLIRRAKSAKVAKPATEASARPSD
jgi:hypothetical protein